MTVFLIFLAVGYAAYRRYGGEAIAVKKRKEA